MERWIRSLYLAAWLLWCVTHMSYSSPCHMPYDISLVKPLLLQASLAASLFPGCLRVMDPFEYQRSPAPWVRNKWYQPHAADCRCCHSNTHSLLLPVPTPPVSERAVTQRSSAVLHCFIHSYQPKRHMLAFYSLHEMCLHTGQSGTHLSSSVKGEDVMDFLITSPSLNPVVNSKSISNKSTFRWAHHSTFWFSLKILLLSDGCTFSSRWKQNRKRWEAEISDERRLAWLRIDNYERNTVCLSFTLPSSESLFKSGEAL